MTDNIITPQFGSKPPERKDEIVFICGCGCKSFYMHQSGAIECAACWNKTYDIPESGKWLKQLENIPATVQGDDGGAISIVAGLDLDMSMARRRVVKQINDNINNLACVFSYNEDGSGQHWTGITTQEEKEWVLRKLELTRRLIEGQAVDTTEG